MNEPGDSTAFLPEEFPRTLRPALVLLGGAAVVGGLTGLAGVAFVFLLRKGEGLVAGLGAVLAGWPPVLGWLALAVTVGVLAAAAAWMVENLAPHAKGSGIPYVEKILRGREVPQHYLVLPVKFLGGLMALSAGLVLGREGPLVQMGAVIGERVGRWFPKLQWAWKSLMAAGAGAGLASAFNAPVGGTIFILEEVFRKVTPQTFILAATASCTSIYIQRAVFGVPQDYVVPEIPEAPSQAVWLFFLFGTATGVLGLLYNRLLLAFLAFGKRVGAVPATLRAGGIGFLVGTVAWFAPHCVGGGDSITQSLLSARQAPAILLGVAAIRFFLGPLSYAAGTPGGLFAPVVALGALFGAAAGALNHSLLPDLVPAPMAFAVAGMAAFFTATVRAPLTGIVICLEMTGCYPLFFPMLSACLGAYLVPTLLGDRPIYDALAEPKK